MLLAGAERPDRPVEKVATVELLTSAQFAALSGVGKAGQSGDTRVPSLAPPPATNDPPDEPPDAPAEALPDAGPVPPGAGAPGGMVTATAMLSARSLANPLSRQAREALPTLAGAERMVQLCNIEAMEQVHAWRAEYQPDRVVAYAMEDLRASDTRLVADGAAIRIGSGWYNLIFRCELAPDQKTVVAFEFQLGGLIPETAWEEHALEPVSASLESHE
jgi:Domain of Unknown Function (DUF930)